MFCVGDVIVCDHNGVCKVVDICEMPQLKPGVLFYQLEPVYTKTSRIIVPVDSKKLVMRPVMSEQEVRSLLEEIPQIEEIGIVNEKKREEQYKEAAMKFDGREWVRIIKTIYSRKQSRNAIGKKITYLDERYMKLAQDNLYNEICIPLNMKPAQMEAYLNDHIPQQTV